jgi:hypothetical protein
LLFVPHVSVCIVAVRGLKFVLYLKASVCVCVWPQR